MLSVVNSILIATIILVLIYVLLNIKNELTAFKGIYNKEQDYKHTRLQKTFSDIDNNEQQLKGKADEHSTTLESHDGRLTTNETKLAEHDTTLSVHDTKLIENRTIIDSNKNLLRNSDNTTIQDIVANNPDVSENDVYSLIGHNNTLINDNYNSVFQVLEKNVDNTTLLKSVAGTKVRMDTDGNVKINVTNPDKLQACDINGENCSHLITRRFIEQLPIQIQDNIENFEVENTNIQTTTVDETKQKLLLSKNGELCGQNSDGDIIESTCKKIGLLGELQGPPGPQGTPGGAFADLTDSEKEGLKGDGISSIVNDENNGTLTFKLTDDTTYTTPDLRGKGIKEITNDENNGTLTFISSDNTTYTTPDLRGNGIEEIVNNSDGTLTFKLTDNKEYKTPDLRGLPGSNGKDCSIKNTCNQLCIDNTCIDEEQLLRINNASSGFANHLHYDHFSPNYENFTLTPYEQTNILKLAATGLNSVNIRVISAGLNTPNKNSRGIFIDGVKVNVSYARSYTLVVLDTYKNIIHKDRYDVYGSSNEGNRLDNNFKKYDENKNILIISTYDEPRRNSNKLSYIKSKVGNYHINSLSYRGCYGLIYRNGSNPSKIWESRRNRYNLLDSGEKKINLLN